MRENFPDRRIVTSSVGMNALKLCRARFREATCAQFGFTCRMYHFIGLFNYLNPFKGVSINSKFRIFTQMKLKVCRDLHVRFCNL